MTKKVKKKDGRGGVRPGSGPPLKYGEPTAMLRFTVPASKKDFINRLVKDHLSAWQIKKS